MIEHTLYNAYTKVPSLNKRSIINFVQTNSSHTDLSAEMISEAIDYAVKEIPSFGGFILTAKKENRMVGAIVVNKTGLNGGNPKHSIVYLALDKKHRQHDISAELIRRAIKLAGGDISLRVEHNSDSIDHFKTLGFQTKYVEMRMTSQNINHG